MPTNFVIADIISVLITREDLTSTLERLSNYELHYLLGRCSEVLRDRERNR